MKNLWKNILESQSNSDLYLSKHIIVDFYQCDNEIIRNAKILEKTLIKASIAIWANVIKSDFNEFEPQWVSWVVILSESHMTIHSWPEYGYVAIDIFACWNMNFKKWLDLFREILKPEITQIVTDLKRGIISKI